MMQCILYDTVHHYASIPHPIRSTSSVEFYLRYDLTADYRTSPVPAILHFYFHFIPLHSISWCSRDLPYICDHLFILSRVTANGSHNHRWLFILYTYYALILLSLFYIRRASRHTSSLYPLYILSISCIHPAPNPFFIFGRILPSVRSYRWL